jgi:hypothetical protein
MIDKSFFNLGETITEFIDSLGDVQQKFEQHMKETELSEEHQTRIKELPKDLHVLVIAEPWSGDVLYYLPVFLNIAHISDWDVRIFRRDQYPELILPYRKEGLYHSIPVIVFFDRDFNEVGRWIERPTIAHQLIEEESLKLRRRLREEYKTEWANAALREFLDSINLEG